MGDLFGSNEPKVVEAPKDPELERLRLEEEKRLKQKKDNLAQEKSAFERGLRGARSLMGSYKGYEDDDKLGK